MKKTDLKDRIYRTLGGTPLTMRIPNQSSRRKPLLYYDGKTNREIRYASNQSSPFVEDQDENVIVESIMFVKGMLHVPSENSVLQHFLSIHPMNGKRFEEVDEERNASEQIKRMDVEDEAIHIAKNLKIDELETIGRVIFTGRNVSEMGSAELKRDVRLFARKNPEKFLQIVEDPNITMAGQIAKLFEDGVLRLRNNGRDIYFNLDNNKKRMMVVPFGEDPIETAVMFLKSDEGLPTWQRLEKELE